MEGAWRHAQNTRRMEPARAGGICRHFINGSCRFGARCNYRHEWPVIPSGQICRYFQKGACWYGERCRYLHVLQPEVDAAVADRRGSVPTVSSSGVAYAQPYRRGSEPALLQAEVMSRQDSGRSGLVVNVSNRQHNTRRLAADIERSQGTGSRLTASRESVQRSEVARACEGRNERTSSNETAEEGGAAAASSSQRNVQETEGFLQSKDVTCGICLDTVYEKADPKSQIFGILPNCSHSFCLQCIMTWRKTRDLGLDVIKNCPQCRVRSAFYVPSKHWVEGQAKERLITAFKAKFSKKSCCYYLRYGRCPFKSECLYQHERDARLVSLLYPIEDEEDSEGIDLLDFFIAMTLLNVDDGEDDDDNDNDDFPFYLSGQYGF